MTDSCTAASYYAHVGERRESRVAGHLMGCVMGEGGCWTVDGGQRDEIACGGPSPASIRGGALVGAFDHRNAGAERRTGEETHAHSCIHERLELSMNTRRLNYHEYEYKKAVLIMSMSSKRKAIFNSTHMNTAVFM